MKKKSGQKSWLNMLYNFIDVVGQCILFCIQVVQPQLIGSVFSEVIQ